MGVSVEQIKKTLTQGGARLEDYFITGDLPCTWSDEGCLLALVIEDDELFLACVEYLRAIGVMEFRTNEEFERARDEGRLP